jgi:hypothetical protein
MLATRHATKGIPIEDPLHQFNDVPTLVLHLISSLYAAKDLADLAKKSRLIFDKYIDWGYENFRQALVIEQEGVREGVGKRVQTNLPCLFSRKSEIVIHANRRKQLMGRVFFVKYIVDSLNGFGPTWINLNDPLPNIQPNGGVGFWFTFKKPINVEGKLFIQVGGYSSQLHKSEDSLLLTTTISPEAFSEPGNFVLNLHVQFDWEVPGLQFDPHQLASVTLVAQ